MQGKTKFTWLTRQQFGVTTPLLQVTELTLARWFGRAMAGRFTYSQRSKEAPMDFTWTDRGSVKPAWAAGSEEQNTPCKRMSSLTVSLKLRLHIRRRHSRRYEPSSSIVEHTPTIHLRLEPQCSLPLTSNSCSPDSPPFMGSPTIIFPWKGISTANWCQRYWHGGP